MPRNWPSLRSQVYKYTKQDLQWCLETAHSVHLSYSNYISNIQTMFVCLLSWCYNPLWLCFHSPVAGSSLLVFSRFLDHTQRRGQQDSSGRVINPSQRPLPDNTQHSTNIHALGGIRTHDLSRRASEDLRLRPRGHWDRQYTNNMYIYI